MKVNEGTYCRRNPYLATLGNCSGLDHRQAPKWMLFNAQCTAGSPVFYMCISMDAGIVLRQGLAQGKLHTKYCLQKGNIIEPYWLKIPIYM